MLSALKRGFADLKIRAKLLIVFLIFMLMGGALAMYSVSEINAIERNYIEFAEEPQQRLAYLSEAGRRLSNIRRYVLSMGYATGDEALLDSLHEKYLLAVDGFRQSMENYHNNLMADAFLEREERGPRRLMSLDITNKFNGEYVPHINARYERFTKQSRDEIDGFMLAAIPIGDDIGMKLDSLRGLTFESVNRRSDELARYTGRAKNTVITLSLCVFALALLLSFAAPRVIKAPIAAMQAAMREIRKGNLTFPIRSGQKDELGGLADSIAEMVDTIAMLNKHVAILDSLDNTISVTDLDCNLLFMNQAIADFYGIDKGGSIGKKCYRAFHGIDEPCPYCPAPSLVAAKESLPSREWERFEEGKNVWIASRTSIIRWLDGSLVKICIGRDNTLKKQHEQNQAIYAESMRKAAEAAREASREKSVFLATMSHEIRTPMNGIIGFSELALDDDISDRTKNYLEKIKSSSQGLLRLINDILDISKIEAGKVSLENIPFDLHEVLRTCQDVITPKAMEKGVTLFCYTEPSISGKLVGDPTRLRQALLNLLANAVKFTHTGIVKFRASAADSGNGCAAIRFEVKDSGIGMSPEQIRRIFEPFMQGDDSTTRRYGGTGLGLTITKNIVELMGGTLEVESAPDVGSKFSFGLTFKTVPADAAGPEPEEERAIEKPVFEGEVLVCEDNALNQQVICDHLSRVGLRAVVAPDGREGVALVRRRAGAGEPPFGLIFMDVYMPVMDGLEAAKQLARMGCKTPVVALTANIMPNDRDVYRQAGMPDCLAKPFTARELWACLLKYLAPVGTNAVSEGERRRDDDAMTRRLRKNFREDNQTTFRDIAESIQTGDAKRAHRIAHTLKGAAGLIGKTALRDAARAVEESLREGKDGHAKVTVNNDQLSTLETELDSVMSELARELDGREPVGNNFVDIDNNVITLDKVVDKTAALDLIARLEPMLQIGDSDCMDMIGELRAVPGTEALIDRMEHFDFAPARETLAGIKRQLEGRENG